MFSIVITEKGGETRQIELDKDEITIGRVDDNDVVLPKGNVSKKHTRIVAKDGRVIVVDLKSTNGTFVNGRKLAAPQVVQPSDRITIGDFTLNVEAPMDAAPPEPELRPSGAVVGDEPYDEPTPPEHPDPLLSPEPEPSFRPPPRNAETAPRPPPPPKAQAKGQKAERQSVSIYGRLLKQIHDQLIEAMDLRRLDMDRLGDQELRARTEAQVRQIVEDLEAEGGIPAEVDREELVSDVMNEALGLGPLEIYLADESVSEIMVNRADQIYVERGGRIQLATKTFSSNQAVMGVIERIVAPLGRHIDESSPLVDARLRDGSRVNAIIPPLALKGPTITIRKFKKDKLRINDIIKYGTITAPMAEFLDTCVKVRKNIVISGGTGSGKTTLLNILSGFIPAHERIITVEDAAELQLPQEHWVQLESRPANIEGKGQISIRELVRNCLRMRPDRIVIGECRGGEALDMLQAMNTGHDGSLTTLHANTPRDALARLETMVLMSGMELPVKAIREQIANAVNLIVQQTRFADGSRRISYISEVSGMEVDIITLQDIFYFKQEGFDAEGRVQGRFVATGFVPKFYDDLQRRGIPVNMDIFREA